MRRRDPDDRKRFGRSYALSVLVHAVFLWMLFAWFVASLEFEPQEARERARTIATTVTIETHRPVPPTPLPRPSARPSPLPRPIATLAVTFPPTYRPTPRPTLAPSPVPTIQPRAVAARTPPPTVAPTAPPTVAPTAPPTVSPTVAPTAPPTVAPTAPPTISPTVAPTVGPPTQAPTVAPTAAATVASRVESTTAPATPVPTRAPTAAPAASPARLPTAAPTLAPTTRPSAGTSDLEARMRRMLASINDPRHYDMKSYATEIAEAEKRLASDYEVLHLRPPPLRGIGANTKAYEFDLGQVLYALRTIKVGPWEICAGWLVTTRGEEQPPAFYVGPCKKSETIADPRDRPRQPGFATPPPLHN